MKTQLALAAIGGPALDPESSRFIRTTWVLRVRRAVLLPTVSAAVRFLDKNEALRLEDNTARRNVFSRHSYERSFYLDRIREFQDRSVIEVIRPGDPKDIATEARSTAETIETACVISTVLYSPRRNLLSSLGITPHRKDVLDFTVGPKFRHLSASSKREAAATGILIDRTFAGRFQRLGMEALVARALADTPMGRRLAQAMSWLRASRMEPALDAAIVKAAIAYEVLLGSTETEPLRRSLSERSAFLLSDDPTTRARLSDIVKTFYDARSQVVHGSTRRRGKALSENLLEAAERIAFMLLVTLSANHESLDSETGIQDWVERQKWGEASSLSRPFRPGDLKRAFARADGRQNRSRSPSA